MKYKWTSKISNIHYKEGEYTYQEETVEQPKIDYDVILNDNLLRPNKTYKMPIKKDTPLVG